MLYRLKSINAVNKCLYIFNSFKIKQTRSKLLIKLVNLFRNFNLSLLSLKKKVLETNSFSSSLVIETKRVFIV